MRQSVVRIGGMILTILCGAALSGPATANDSAFALLSGQTTTTVQILSSTQQDVTVSNGTTVRVRGLLFFNGGTQAYTLVASHIEQQ